MLPNRYESKLLFPLCKTCAQNGIKQELLQRSKKCPHSTEERSLTGRWTTIELEKFTNELDEGDHITEFVAAGPKNYAYITKQGKKCCKVRGFTLNERGQQILHFTSMKDLVLNEILLPT